MNCERTLEILTSVKNKTNIRLNKKEIDELSELGLISIFTPEETERAIKSKLSELKKDFIQLSEEVRNLNKEIISNEGDFEQLSLLEKILSYIYLGSGAHLKQQKSNYKKELELKETHLNDVKERVIELTAQQESFDRAVKVNGKSIFLTPTGESIFNEINARKRFAPRELHELLEVVNRLDKQYTDLLSQIEEIMKKNKFQPIWGAYLINLDKTSIAPKLNKIAKSSVYYYRNPDKKMMEVSLEALLPPGHYLPRSNRLDPFNKISSAFMRYSSFFKIKDTVKLIGKAFAAWAVRSGVDESTDVPGDIENYIENLESLIKRQGTTKGEARIKNLASAYDEETALSLIVLALTNPESYDKFEFLYDKLNDVPTGRKFFAAIATLFPWDQEEIWQVLVRAQSNVLKSESAKFLPELIEYALLLTINPEIIAIENNITEEELQRWRYLVIPIIQIIIFSYIERKLEKYIMSRPLSYVTSPRTSRYRYYRRRSSLHYHHVG